MEVFRKKNVQITLCIVFIILIGIGGYFLIAGNLRVKPVEQAVDQDVVQVLSPKEIGLTMQASPDNKKVRFKIAKASDIKSIEYELTYEADSTAEERIEGSDDQVQRGITGEAKVNGKSPFQSEWLILGSQSANVVRYDTGVMSVSITLKIVKFNKKIYQVKDTLKLDKE